LIQSSFGDHGDFEVVVVETQFGPTPSATEIRAVHYFRDNDIENFPWGPCAGNAAPPCQPTGEPTEDPITGSNFEDSADLPSSAASLIQNTFSSGSSIRGNLEVMLRQGEIFVFGTRLFGATKLCHYTENDNTGQWGPAQPPCIEPQSQFLSAPATIETGTGLFGHFQMVIWALSADGQTPQLLSMGEDGTEVIPTIDVPPNSAVVAQAQ
jgi:hypothetical protein